MKSTLFSLVVFSAVFALSGLLVSTPSARADGFFVCSKRPALSKSDYAWAFATGFAKGLISPYRPKKDPRPDSEYHWKHAESAPRTSTGFCVQEYEGECVEGILWESRATIPCSSPEHQGTTIQST
jgi:hypothetical protein